jgi:hypothetical protein
MPTISVVQFPLGVLSSFNEKSRLITNPHPNVPTNPCQSRMDVWSGYQTPSEAHVRTQDLGLGAVVRQPTPTGSRRQTPAFRKKGTIPMALNLRREK